MKKALLFGATGFIGSHLLQDLLNNSDYEQVIIVVRKPIPTKHPKLKVLIGDYQSLPKLKSELVADEIFIALGTTTKNTPDRKKYYEIDHDYPVAAAKIAKENGAKSVFIVTAVGANENSNFFYIRTKGEVERDIKALGFKHTHIFEPSMILGQREEFRALEKTLISFWGGINLILAGPLDKYKGIDGKDIARAMIKSAQFQKEKIKTYRWKEMSSFLLRKDP